MMGHQFYREWHQDRRTPILSWAIVAAFFGLSLNVISFSQEMSDAGDYLSASTAFASTLSERTGSPSFSLETNRIVVKFRKDIRGLNAAAEHANIEKAEGLRRLFTIDGIDARVYEVSEADTASEVVGRIKASHGNKIAYAEVDMLAQPAYTPNDPMLTNQWHLNKIQAPAAWDTTKGDGVTVAILDSGVDCTQPDLATRCVPGWNVASNSSNTADINGHGTAVASTLAEIGDNAIGFAGVAYNVKIMPVRLTDDPTNQNVPCSNIANGIIYAADHSIRVASNSYSILGCSVVTDAANYMASKGGIYVRSAGNGNSTDPTKSTGIQLTDANSPNVVITSATDRNDAKTTWSNFGTPIDIAAPGTDVSCIVKGAYGYCWGTSFSTPITAGILALEFSANPDLSQEQAKSILFSSADDLGAIGWDMYYGYGRVNAAKAVAMAAATIGTGGPDTQAPLAPTNLQASNISASQVTLSWTASTDNVGIASYDVYRDGTKIANVAGTVYTDTGLRGETSYAYTVAARDVAGNVSGLSNSVSITTLVTPLTITSSTVVSKTGMTATVTSSTNKPATVVVRYGLTATALTLTATGSSTAATTQSTNLAGLKPKTKYFYQVTATSETGESAASAVLNFRTASR